LGKYFYSLLHNVDFIIGNSSSGIIEAPSLKTFTINVGTRQKGRVMSKSVLNCKNSKIEIKKNINKIYRIRKNNINNFFNPYYQSNAGNMITKILKNYKKLIIYKNKFYDL
jgi:UDP-N-acetylglucosamine 2-epimerase